jgi:glucokinase
MSMVNLLAADIGGTTTRLGLFEKTPHRPRLVAAREFPTLDFPDLPSMIAVFLRAESRTDVPIASACFGVAGPVTGDTAKLTNIPWRVDAADVARAFGVPHVRLLNDLEAMAYAVPVLEASETHVLQEGQTAPGSGNMAVIAAGTGLGEAILHHVDGRYVAVASEAGHADFAARTEREIALLRHLVARYGRAQVEDVVSGRGLLDIHRVVHTADSGELIACAAAIDLDAADAPAAISAAALDRRCAGCVETLSLLVGAYGAEAGNLALRAVAAGGVFIGGGIAPKILAALTSGAFISAFRAKAPFESMLSAMPVRVIINDGAGLLGAANFCSHI